MFNVMVTELMFETVVIVSFYVATMFLLFMIELCFCKDRGMGGYIMTKLKSMV